MIPIYTSQEFEEFTSTYDFHLQAAPTFLRAMAWQKKSGDSQITAKDPHMALLKITCHSTTPVVQARFLRQNFSRSYTQWWFQWISPKKPKQHCSKISNVMTSDREPPATTNTPIMTQSRTDTAVHPPDWLTAWRKGDDWPWTFLMVMWLTKDY